MHIVAALLLASASLAQDSPSRAERVARLAELADPARDDWASERWAATAEQQLAALSAASLALLHAEGELPDVFAVPFAAGDPRPADVAQPLGSDALRALRFPAGAFAGEPGAPPFATDPRAFLARLLAPFAGARELRLAFEVESVEAQDGAGFRTRVRYEARGRIGAAALQQDGAWSVDWSGGGESPPRIARIAPIGLDEVRAARPLFEDATGSVIGDAGGSSALARLGCDHWRERIDALGEPNFWGHNGIAVGDVNGDDLDDLYVAMGTGVPNLLFVQNPDGTATERAHEAGCAWLDDTKGVLLVDYDGDGDQDLVCAVGPTLLVSDNDGMGRFTPARSLRAATDAAFYGIAAADYDLDGDLDLYAVRYVKVSYGGSVPMPYHDARNGPRNHLLRNDGADGFRDVTEAVGLDAGNDRFSLAPCWTDYDGDGDPDLYVANDFGRSNLYRNEGGRFVDVAAAAGVENVAAGMGTCFADVELDGDLDLLVSNMYEPAGLRVATQPRFQTAHPKLRDVLRGHALGNALYLARGDGRFEDASDRAGIRMGRWAWGALFGDFDGDGLPDVVVPTGFLTNREPRELASFFWRQVASRSPAGTDAGEIAAYEDAWAATTSLMDAGWSWSGRERDVACWNVGGAQFVDASGVFGLDLEGDSRAVAATDWNGDGALDLWHKSRTSPALRFLLNTNEVRGDWIALRLVGTRCNRDAIGARVELRAGGRTYLAERRAGEGYLSQSSPWLLFHVGGAERIESLVVRWPGGDAQEVAGLELGRRYRIVQGDDAPLALAPRAVALDARPLAPAAPASWDRVVLRTPLPLPPAPRRKLFDQLERGRALLVVLWSPGEPAAIDGLARLAERAGELAAVGLDVVPVAVGSEEERARAPELFAQRVAPSLAPPGFALAPPVDRAHELLLELLRHALPQGGARARNASLLVDRNDMLAVVYLGSPALETLLEDARTLGAQPSEVRVRASFPGTWFFGMPRDLARLAERLRAIGFAGEAGFYETLLRLQERRR